MRGFLSALAFLALLMLALNPRAVIEIENRIWPVAELPGLPDLPETYRPEDGTPLPRIPGYEGIARNDVWIGEAPCSVEMFDAPDTLPGTGPRRAGGPLDTPMPVGDDADLSGQPTYLYDTPTGAKLRYVAPQIVYYDVAGRNFRAAQTDIFTRKPLNRPDIVGDRPDPDGDAVRNARIAVLAHILSPSVLTYTMTGRVRPRNTTYTLIPTQTVMTSAFVVTLPRWTGYDDANSRDKARWDDLFCNAAHHELGHLRIRVDLLSQTLDGYASLSGQSQAELQRRVTEYREDIAARIRDRQDAYHVYNGGGIRRGMTELPYAELPFPWLETDAPELFAEDIP